MLFLYYHQFHCTIIDLAHTLALYLNINKIQSWSLGGWKATVQG